MRKHDLRRPERTGAKGALTALALGALLGCSTSKVGSNNTVAGEPAANGKDASAQGAAGESAGGEAPTMGAEGAGSADGGDGAAGAGTAGETMGGEPVQSAAGENGTATMSDEMRADAGAGAMSTETAGEQQPSDMTMGDAGTALWSGSVIVPFKCPSGIESGSSPWGNRSVPKARLVVTTGFRFLEGPVWFAERQELYFSDIRMDIASDDGPPSRIHRYDTVSGEVSVFAERGNSNGLAVAPDGRLLAATHDQRTISFFDLDSEEREVLSLSFMGEPFNSPNDLTVRSDGQIFFSDPDWQRAGRDTNINMTGVYRLNRAGDLQLLDGGLNKPNGISFSPDEQVLYVGSLEGTYSYPVNADGSLGERKLFAPVNSDGMAVDCAGNVYLTSETVQVFSPQGDMLGAIVTEGESPTNAAFGGPEGKTLYITAGKGLFAVDLNVPGFPY